MMPSDHASVYLCCIDKHQFCKTGFIVILVAYVLFLYLLLVLAPSSYFNNRVLRQRSQSVLKNYDFCCCLAFFDSTIFEGPVDEKCYFVHIQAFEKFLFESMALSTKLDEIRRRLLQEDFAMDVAGIREQIQQNNHVKKWIVKAPIEILEEEACKVIKIIKDSCNCDREDELNDEGRNAVHQARSMMETLFSQRATLKQLWQGRKIRLEQCLQFNIFKQDAEKVCSSDAQLYQSQQACNNSDIYALVSKRLSVENKANLSQLTRADFVTIATFTHLFQSDYL